MKSLNGYWVNKADKSISLYVERVYKKGYVTGFKYHKIAGATVHSQFKATHEELQNDYERDE